MELRICSRQSHNGGTNRERSLDSSKAPEGILVRMLVGNVDSGLNFILYLCCKHLWILNTRGMPVLWFKGIKPKIVYEVDLKREKS